MLTLPAAIVLILTPFVTIFHHRIWMKVGSITRWYEKGSGGFQGDLVAQMLDAARCPSHNRQIQNRAQVVNRI
jgi:hypothetical protein